METLIGLAVLLVLVAIALVVPVAIVAWLYRARVGAPETAALRLMAELEAVQRPGGGREGPDR